MKHVLAFMLHIVLINELKNKMLCIYFKFNLDFLVFITRVKCEVDLKTRILNMLFNKYKYKIANEKISYLSLDIYI